MIHQSDDLIQGVAVFRSSERNFDRHIDGIRQVIFDWKHRASPLNHRVGLRDDVAREAVLVIAAQDKEVAIVSRWAARVEQKPVGGLHGHRAFDNGPQQDVGHFEVNQDHLVAVGQAAKLPFTHLVERIRPWNRFRDDNDDRQLVIRDGRPRKKGQMPRNS